MGVIKRFSRFITSLGLAIGLFMIIAAYSIIGTVLPQGLEGGVYAERYGSFAVVIKLLQFDRVYSSLFFRILLVLFMVNLVGCTLKLLPQQLRRMRPDYLPAPSAQAENHYHQRLDVEKLQQVLKRAHYRIHRTEDGFRATKHRIGQIGSSVTHLGVVIIILGSFVGSLLAQDGFFNMLPGDVRSFAAQGFSLRLDDFQLVFREDGSVEQYVSKVTLLESGVEVKSEELWVNNSFQHQGLDFYQTSYGWASELVLRDADGKQLASKLLRQNESYFYQPEHLSILLYGFFPDMVVTERGEPLNMTERKNNPFYAVVLYHYGEHVGSYLLEPGQPLQHGEISIVFPDSTLYTGITYRRDVGYPFVLLGSFFLLLGLFFSFYTYPKCIVLAGNSLVAVTRQNSWGFNYQLKRYVDAASN